MASGGPYSDDELPFEIDLTERTPEYLLCIDFDETITRKHFHNYLALRKVRPSQGVKYLDTLISELGLKNPDLMRQAIQTAIKNGHKVAITSYNMYPEVIKPVLAYMGLSELELQNIVIVGGFPANDGSLNTTDLNRSIALQYGKSLHIKAAMIAHNIKHNSVILLDDSPRNIQSCAKGHIGILVLKDREEQNYLYELLHFVGRPARIQVGKLTEISDYNNRIISVFIELEEKYRQQHHDVSSSSSSSSSSSFHSLAIHRQTIAKTVLQSLRAFTYQYLYQHPHQKLNMTLLLSHWQTAHPEHGMKPAVRAELLNKLAIIEADEPAINVSRLKF
jgi:hydroxymethylpyrimidine pyrophosphatase-like HAD family hydrolase